MRALLLVPTLLLPLLLASVSACDPDKGDDTSVEGDADADADADGDSDSDSDSDTDRGDCPAYTSFAHLGGTWEYGYTAEYQAANQIEGGWTFTTASESADGQTWYHIFQELYLSSEIYGYTYDASYVMDYRCDSAGLWLHGASSTYEMFSSGKLYEGWSETEYEPAAIMPWDIDVGSTWSYTLEGTTVTDSAPGTNFSISTSMRADARVSVDVPAGSFETLEIRVTTSGETPTSSQEWLNQDIGLIASEGIELLVAP